MCTQATPARAASPKGMGSESDDDLFKPRAAPSQQPGHDGADAIDALDSAVSVARDGATDIWSSSAAVESLRNRFVTGNACLKRLAAACASVRRLHHARSENAVAD